MDNTEMKVEVELTAAQKLAQMEKEKLTRRQALARFGFQAGAAAVAALTADELLRKVGVEMRKRAGDNQVAQQVAGEFEKAGMAHAITESAPICTALGGCTQCVVDMREYKNAHCGQGSYVCGPKANTCISMCQDVKCPADDEANHDMPGFLTCVANCLKENGTRPTVPPTSSGYGNCSDCAPAQTASTSSSE